MKIIEYKDLTIEQAKAGCFVLNMPNDAYHSYDGISKSSLDLVNRSPAHYHFRAPTEPSRAMELGTALHTAVFEPERFKDEYCLLRNVTARTASEYKQAVKIHGSERVLVANEISNIESIQETLRSNCHLAPYNRFEVSAFVEKDGVLLRCRFDAINLETGEALDLKTTQNSSREEFSKSVYNYRYFVQDAFYSYVYFLITGKKLNSFKFLAVENNPPHCPMMYELDDEAKIIGHREAMRNIDEYKTSDMNQGYPQTNEKLMLPSWALARYENELQELIK